MFRYSRNAIKLVNNKRFNRSISSRALSLSVSSSNNSNNNGTSSSSNYGGMSLLASVLVGAVITLSTHKVTPTNISKHYYYYYYYYSCNYIDLNTNDYN